MEKSKANIIKERLSFKKIIKQNRNAYLKTRNDPFFSICRTIIGQQISIKAADSIWAKFRIKCNKKIQPKVIIKLNKRTLRSVGLSHQKVSYLQNIAKSFVNKSSRQFR